VTTQVKNLSGGEKARLCLAYIAAQSPQLLLLDEITNNVDGQTRAHIIEVLKEYPGAMIIVTHDSRFLQALSVATVFETKARLLRLSEI
jgi:ATPase subunit of ABC transporter with duplicated ATPase domains